MTERVILVEIVVTSPIGAVSTLRFSDRAVRPFPPTDADRANVTYDSRIIEPPTLRRALFDDLASLGPSLGYGQLTLANADHGLDAYQGHLWGAIRVWRWTVGTEFSAALPLLSGLCAPPGYDPGANRASRVRVTLTDERLALDATLQNTLYAGTNGGSVLYEGEADGLKGKPKPLAWGRLTGAYIPAPKVNNGVYAYQLHDGPIQGAVTIQDRGDGAGLASDGDKSGSTFDAWSPAAAHYVTDLGRGLVKFNSSPVGITSFGFNGDKTGGTYIETAGPVLASVLAKSGVAAAKIGASIAALAVSAPIGVYVGDQTRVADVTALLARSAFAALLPDQNGVWQATAFGPPADAPDFVIAADQVIDLSADATAPLPAGECRVAWGRHYQVFTGTDLAPALRNTASEASLAEEWRWATVENAAIKARPASTWRKVEIQTALQVEADAIAWATAYMALFGLRADGAPRRMWKVTIEASDEALALALGKTVELNFPANAFATGLFLLLAAEPLRPRRDQVVWTVWG